MGLDSAAETAAMTETVARRAFLSALGASPLVPELAPGLVPELAPGLVRAARIKLSCNLYSFNAPLRSGEMTLEQVIDFCAELGFDAVDPTGYYFPGYPEPPADTYLYAVKRRAFLSGLDVSGTGVRNDFTQPEASKREADVAHVGRWAEVAAKLGAPVLRVFDGRAEAKGPSREQMTGWVVEAFRACAAHGERHGVMIAYQNHDELLKTADEVLALRERRGVPVVRAQRGRRQPPHRRPVRGDRAARALRLHVADQGAPLPEGAGGEDGREAGLRDPARGGLPRVRADRDAGRGRPAREGPALPRRGAGGALMTEAKARSSFPSTFWVANVMELFERGAYYGMNSVLAVYLAGSVAEGGLGFGEQSVGFLQSIVYAATYVLPILGGALADRYGYRRMLLVAFSFLTAGYFAAGHVSSYGLVFLSLLVMATGSGLFKPIISGTIARTTDESNSAFGFGIYYWMINLGAFLAPLLVSVLKGFSWRYVFVASALYTGLMLLPTVFVFRDPPRPQSTKALREVLMGAAEVLADSRFMLMIVVYSGFWVLYFQNFGSVLWYLRDFVDRAPVSSAVTSLLQGLGLSWTFTFDAEHVTVINAGTIILLQVFVSRLVKDWKPLPTMVTGMALGAVGFLLLASSRNPWVFVLGIAVFSIGEMTAHPKYYSFVGQVAPADRKAVYMGYAFLYGVLGSLLGSSLGAFLYERMLKPALGTPEADARARTFWLLFAVLDVVAAAGLVLFARSFGTDTVETRRRARAIMRLVYAAVLLIGGVFLYVAFSSTPVQARTAVQAAIFIALGAGGLFMGRSRE